MKDFQHYLETIGEIGYVTEVLHSIVNVSGLPHASPREVVLFESGDIGEIMSLQEDKAEVLLLTDKNIQPGAKVARTGGLLSVGVGEGLLGNIIDALGRPIYGSSRFVTKEMRPIYIKPMLIIERTPITKPLETGVALVDFTVPLAKGQRELVIGDRGTGKSLFLRQVLLSQAQKGVVCIYVLVGKRQHDLAKVMTFLQNKGIMNKTIVVSSNSTDPSGLVFATPYTAMTIAEYFRDKGMDVLVIIDDLTTHANYYRELSLLARRFPGRSSYPGDIFYIHARLLERAGSFAKGSITCLPAADSVLGDLAGFIQTNLMAMTDGHIYFDTELFDQGRRPAVNPFLSVTRVGHQVQTRLTRELSRELTSFLVEYEKMKQFTHFGAEAGETVKKTLKLGKRITAFFDQLPDTVIPLNINILILGGIWVGNWNTVDVSEMLKNIVTLIGRYGSDAVYRDKVDKYIQSVSALPELASSLRQDSSILSVK